MKTINRIVVAAVAFLLLSTSAWADKYQETKQIFIDGGIGEMFSSAYGYALFPNIAKGGVGIGGAYGKGRVYESGMYIGDTSMAQASIGLQLGGKGFSQVVFFEDKRALDEFISGNFQFGAGAQATVITAAAEASASTGGSSATASGGKNNAAIGGSGYTRGMATYQITKGGLMFEASISGQNFSFSKK